KLGTIPQVLAKQELIERVRTNEFWNFAAIYDYEMVRKELRGLIKFIAQGARAIYYTDFSDEIMTTQECPGEFRVEDLQDYKKKVNQYIREHQDHMAIYKLKH
ncbi:MAG TPA: hypothetical protein DDW93_13050, partial [Firmicutes bacterium]|nr:hypothetical protein [Bacillota bacterium]